MAYNRDVAIISTAFVNQTEINSGIDRVKSKFAGEIEQIRYSLGEDWNGSDSIFFRVVLSDEVSRNSLRSASFTVQMHLIHEVEPEKYGLQSYFNFRSASEQRELKDPDWA